MKEGGKIHKKILNKIIQKATIGVTTNSLNELTNELCKQYKVYPSFLGYRGFSKSICTCINEEIVHGIPSDRILQEKDILSIDLGILYKNYHTDGCFTMPIGQISSEAENLIKITKKSLQKAINIIKDGIKLGDVSNIIETTANNAGYKVIENFTGHGIGKKLHEAPQILNYGQKGTGPVLKKGMTLAIEPILTAGTKDNYTAKDKWTAITKDHSLTAQFEHTIVVTKKGCEIIT